jgi:hypothetical protein
VSSTTPPKILSVAVKPPHFPTDLGRSELPQPELRDAMYPSNYGIKGLAAIPKMATPYEVKIRHPTPGILEPIFTAGMVDRTKPAYFSFEAYYTTPCHITEATLRMTEPAPDIDRIEVLLYQSGPVVQVVRGLQLLHENAKTIADGRVCYKLPLCFLGKLDFSTFPQPITVKVYLRTPTPACNLSIQHKFEPLPMRGTSPITFTKADSTVYYPEADTKEVQLTAVHGYVKELAVYSQDVDGKYKYWGSVKYDGPKGRIFRGTAHLDTPPLAKGESLVILTYENYSISTTGGVLRWEGQDLLPKEL